MVTWDRITAECDGFRAGFVAIFRKYEGQPTDAKDAYGRPVKVTKASFAERVLKITPQAFGHWIRKTEEGSTRVYPSPGTTRSGQMGRQIAKSPTTAVDDKVGMLHLAFGSGRDVVESGWFLSPPASRPALGDEVDEPKHDDDDHPDTHEQDEQGKYVVGVHLTAPREAKPHAHGLPTGPCHRIGAAHDSGHWLLLWRAARSSAATAVISPASAVTNAVIASATT
jgi:hypothetical protein